MRAEIVAFCCSSASSFCGSSASSRCSLNDRLRRGDAASGGDEGGALIDAAPGGRLRGRARRLRVAPGGPVAVTADEILHAAAGPFEHQQVRHHAVEEVAIVAHEQQSTVEFGDALLQQVERVHVEVVGGLVHHEEVRRLREQPGEQQPVAFPAGQRADGRVQLVRPEQELPQIAGEMATLPVDHHVVAALVDVVHHRRREVQLRALLVVVRHLQPRATAHRAARRLEVPEDQLEQRALAGAIRADDADAVTAQDACREAMEDLAPAEVDRGFLRFEHELRGFGCLLHVEAGAPDAIHARAPLVAHLEERPHAALVARASRLDALADPHFLLRETLVELGVLLRLVAQQLGLALGVHRVVAGPGGERAAIEVDDARRHRIDESPVVADEEQRARIVAQERLEPFDRGDVQMVGGLIEQQQLRARDERPAEQRASPPSAGERRVARAPFELQVREHGGHALLHLPAVRRVERGLQLAHAPCRRVVVRSLGIGVGDRVPFGEQGRDFGQSARDHALDVLVGDVVDVLREGCHACSRSHPDSAGVGRGLAAHQPEQRGLPAPFRPTMHTLSPGSICRLAWCSRCSEPKARLTSSRRSRGSWAAGIGLL